MSPVREIFIGVYYIGKERQMLYLVSKSSEFVYQKALKPILFRRQPDNVHHALLRHGALLQKSSLVRSATNAVWAYRNEAYLAQTILGLRFKNPVGLSAGFDKNFELIPLIKSVGFGFMEGGSVTYQLCDGNPRPWFYRLPKTKSLVVYAGLANEGVEAITERVLSYPASTFTNFPINISVAKTNSQQAASESDAIDDYLGTLRHLLKADVGDMYTLNISCPNTYGGEPFTTPAKLERLLREVDSLALKKPVFIKMPAELPWREFKKLLDVAIKHQVAGVTISNLAKDRGAAKLKDPLPDSVKGNLSGKPTFDLSNSLIQKTYHSYGDRFVIIGVGGIFSAEDAYTKIKLGASLVELITGMIFEGPQLIGQINKDLVGLLKADGYVNVSEAIGVGAGIKGV
jgi:dihydroorotate dehydrogenase